MSSVSIRNLDLSFGAVDVLKNLNLEIAEGEFLVLLGSSGCGKSTLLNCIAGLIDVSGGQIHISGRNVTWEEPSDRGIGMVFQSYALYPQMTVEGNLSFGLKNQRMPKDQIAQRVARAAEILQIEPLLKRKPGALSGGQRQRVAIGRALVREADVFLFDEPLSNLDAKLRTDLRVELKALHKQLKNTMIYVTHDQVEAMTLADRIAIMRDGKIQQLDTPSVIYGKPRNKYVADFIGSPSMNFFEGDLSAEAGSCVFEGPDFTLPLTSYEFETPQIGRRKAWLGLRPEHIVTGEAAAAADLSADTIVDIVEPMGSDTLVWVNFGGKPIRVRTDGQSDLEPGDTLRIGLQSARASIFDHQSEDRL
ncbi:ABC transporter ATP-binding protein [Pontivivens insulae]|uniref:sn-glycerol-3-phosphate import ATP-binding protein UgpC n=1 Tax=Pontivivens insulae TaxID=1639689 RepID=A0A2R8A8Z5_9RHOB|nr:ABC transporter ATP-binding protein [Pontivivens insulae]RED18799.1 carbohydrate ABC transporter ATP-binding protein (CUT1 family) [Pontivivens insulae]SPF28697.1 sn-glycerol-3-phosphate import ATP-binding protein UgpC [Pontivivens insulae]